VALTTEKEGQEVLKCGFGLRLHRKHIARTQSEQTELKKIPQARVTVFHVPKFVGCKSEILHYHQLCMLWYWLPDTMRINDAHLLFRGSKDGYRLATMLGKIGSTNTPHLIVIKDKNGAIFGGFFCSKLERRIGR